MLVNILRESLKIYPLFELASDVYIFLNFIKKYGGVYIRIPTPKYARECLSRYMQHKRISFNISCIFELCHSEHKLNTFCERYKNKIVCIPKTSYRKYYIMFFVRNGYSKDFILHELNINQNIYYTILSKVKRHEK